MIQSKVIEVPVHPGLNGRFGIVDGKLQYITNPSLSVTWRFENEEYLIFFEGEDAKKIMREIYFSDYKNLVFKIYKVKNGVKSDKYYYLLNGEIRSLGTEDYYLLKIPELNKISFFKAEDFKLLNLVMQDYKKYDQVLVIFNKSKITYSKIDKGEPNNGIQCL